MKQFMQCTFCKGNISPAAKACPHCGHPNSLPVPWALVIFAIAVFIGTIFVLLKLWESTEAIVGTYNFLTRASLAVFLYGISGLVLAICYFVIRAKFGSRLRIFWHKIHKLPAKWERCLGSLIWALLRWPFNKKPRD